MTLALSVGDPAGIGPEIVLKSLLELTEAEHHGLVVVADAEVLARHADACCLPLTVTEEEIHLEDGRRISLENIKSLSGKPWQIGHTSAACGQACLDYAAHAVKMVQMGRAKAVVAAPHTEKAVQEVKKDFRGYPGLVAELTGTPPGDTFLFLLSPILKVTNVTLHQTLESVVKSLDHHLITQAIRATHEVMCQLGKKNPSIAVCGIDPHAGEQGSIGYIDRDLVLPCVELMRGQGLNVFGPSPADALFADHEHDAYVAMYHDQGHIPVKLTAPHQASAITIGTSVPFGSVAHGSAHNIAGKNHASPVAFLNAIRNIRHLESSSKKT